MAYSPAKSDAPRHTSYGYVRRSCRTHRQRRRHAITATETVVGSPASFAITSSKTEKREVWYTGPERLERIRTARPSAHAIGTGRREPGPHAFRYSLRPFAETRRG
jgi:hypothetical protein